MHPDEDVRFLHRLPERIELGQGERTAALPCRHGRRVEEERLRPVVDHEAELLEGPLEHREADHRSRVHRIGIVERPVLEHPTVERVKDDLNGVWILGQPLLDTGGERRPDHGLVDAHVLHEGQPGLGVEKGLHRRDASPVLGVGRLAAGRSHAGEGGIGDEVAYLVLDGDLGAIPDVDVLDDAVIRGRKKHRQGIPVLVHVVVGVEHRIGQAPLPHVDKRI